MSDLTTLKVKICGQGKNIVFAHGTPTYSGEYQNVVKELESQYQCVLIDHLGFGDSPKPFDGDYSLAAHQKRFRDTLISKEIKSFHLVVHDFGGVIALPLLFDSEFEILSLTIINSWYWPLIETEPQIKSQKFLVQIGLLPFLYRHFNLSPKVLLKLAWGKHSPLTRERHEHYINKFPFKKDRSGTLGFLYALFDFENSAWQNSEKLKSISTPIQIVWGCADKLISERNLQRWQQLIPQAKIIKLENVGHFVADEAPDLLAKELTSFCK